MIWTAVLRSGPEAEPAPPSDDPIAASLRGFGPLGLSAILLIVSNLCLPASERHPGAAVGLAVTYAMAGHRIRAT